MSRCLLGALLLHGHGAVADINMLGVMPVVDALNTYHPANPQGAPAFSCPSTSAAAASSCDTLAHGRDGTDGDSTNVFRAVTNVDNVVWPEDVGDSEVVTAADIPESLGLFGVWCCLIALVAVVAVVEKQPVSARPCGCHSVHIASRK